MKECFGRTITDSDKLDECRTCELREACQAVQWGQESSGARIVGSDGIGERRGGS
jgi:hypothetical protein